MINSLCNVNEKVTSKIEVKLNIEAGRRKLGMMKQFVYYIWLGLIFWFLAAGPVLAQTFYVSGVMKITLRTGPGVEHKIIAMITTGDPLEMLEQRSDWSQVRTQSGKEGWVLTRFITMDEPLSIVVDRLTQKNQALSEDLAESEKQSATLSEQLKIQNSALMDTQKKLADIEKSYGRLQKESAGFLALQKIHQEMSSQFQGQQERIAVLEKNLGRKTIRWFLSGAAVLVVGILLGMSARKKRQRSLL